MNILNMCLFYGSLLGILAFTGQVLYTVYVTMNVLGVKQ